MIKNTLRTSVVVLSLLTAIYSMFENAHSQEMYVSKLKEYNTTNYNNQRTIDSLSTQNNIITLEKEAVEEIVQTIPIHAPLDTLILVSKFGWRNSPTDTNNTAKFHGGVDYDGEKGDTIFASGNGYVNYAGWLGGYGKTVSIEHLPGIRTLYGHMNKILIDDYQFVHQGEPIGLLGSSGNVTGSHLHYEIWMNGERVNPEDFQILY